jgi:hypothetical protein
LDEKVNLAAVELVAAGGPESIVVCGRFVLIVQP